LVNNALADRGSTSMKKGILSRV